MDRTLTASLAVLDCEISEVRLILEAHAGVLIDKSAEAFHDHLACYLSANRLSTADDLITLLRQSPSACDALLATLLPADTSFFRFPKAFDALTRDVVPEIIERKCMDPARTLRLWSAGCSTGEEAYSIAIALCEALHADRAGWKTHIVASDISANALKFAERGVYEPRAMAAVPPHLVTSYFSRIGPQFMVKTRVRSLVSFNRMNFAHPAFLGHFNCIFCMGVLPQLSSQHRTAFVRRLHMFLEPGGYLFLGQDERLASADVSFLPEAHGSYTLYRRPMAAAARSGR
jgi:two-component system, chemotaxis family, CheB/CheR fusion protein